MAATLTKAETEDFAAAEVPAQVLTAAAQASTPRSDGKLSKTRRFTFKRLNRKTEVIAESEQEDAEVTASPASSASTSSLSTTATSASKHPVGPQDFDLLCVIGMGAFGKVIQVRHQPTDEILAMKIVSNKYIVQHNSVSYLQAERDIMTKINHPFLISLRYAFQTKSNVYLLTLPKWLGPETHSILKQLLERNVDKRLGSGKSTMFQVKGVQAIKKHAFFKGIDWHLLEEKKVQPPILPNVMSNTDTTYFSEEFTTQDVGRRSRIDSNSASGGDSKKLFARFSWVADDAPSFADIVRAGGQQDASESQEEDSALAIEDGVAKVSLDDKPKSI
ncbi:hypothetical protein PHYBOEH_003637 [Phytophthora boehmeriae]|uniref:AGC protein kinase n=1 Tax=Phytophthora boehmeriae TaxID=109152 RepID=A0A8T1WTC9_9STRA|nr:hypothetical protein PHYBOEH_003637 [Phytophthora boehmeriae]